MKDAPALLMVLALPQLATGGATKPADASDRLFGADRITTVEIQVGQGGIGKLQSQPRLYVPAVVSVDGQTFSNAQLHLKGHGSFEPVTQKPNLMVRLDKRSNGKKAFGHKRLLLDNSSQDPSFIRWKVAAELFRKAGLPAARINFATVRFNQRNLGLYLMVEPTDKAFLRRDFGSAAGNLYEGSNTDVEDKLDLDSGDPASAYRDLQALASACQEPDLERRWVRLREILDVDRFASFMALEVLVCHHDGYSLDRNNFRIYHDPRTDRMVFVPQGLDLIFSPPELPLNGPWRGTVAHALMETPPGEALYRTRLAELAKMVYGSDDLDQRISGLAGFLTDQLPQASHSLKPAVANLLGAVRTRKRFVLEQAQDSVGDSDSTHQGK